MHAVATLIACALMLTASHSFCCSRRIQSSVCLSRHTIELDIAQPRRRSRLNAIDIFGLGVPEVGVIILVFSVFYGPELRKKRGENLFDEDKLKPLERDQRKKIRNMVESAEGARKKRSMQRLQEAIERGDPVILDKLAALESEEAEDEDD